MTAASTPPSSIRPTASSVVNAVTCRCAILLGRPLPQTWIWASTICMACSPLVLERAPEGLIPRLWGGNAAHEFLAVAHIEIEVGEELLLGQGIGRVDAEVGSGPRRAHTRRTAHL